MRTQVVIIGGGPARLLLDQRMQQADVEYLEASVAAQTSLAENYIGLPYWRRSGWT